MCRICDEVVDLKKEKRLSLGRRIMEYRECPECGEEISSDWLMENNITIFGDEFDCPFCKAELKFEYEYMSYDNIGSWITSR